MNEKNNDLYILCLEYGYKNRSEGISYDDLVKHLKSLGIVFDEYLDTYLVNWFFENFFLDAQYRERIQNKVPPPNANKIQSGGKAIMMLETQQKYIDYLSLKENERKTNVAILIAIISILATISIGGLQVLATYSTNAQSKEDKMIKMLEQNLLKLQTTSKDTISVLYLPKQECLKVK